MVMVSDAVLSNNSTVSVSRDDKDLALGSCLFGW